MDDNTLLYLIQNTLQKNNDLKNNEIFSILSLFLLNQISNIYLNKNNESSMANFDEITEELNNRIEGNDKLTDIMGSLQQSDNNDLQKMLPLLLGALNGSNNNNLGNLMNIFKSTVDNNNDKELKKNNENNESNDLNNQKSKKKRLTGADWDYNKKGEE